MRDRLPDMFTRRRGFARSIRVATVAKFQLADTVGQYQRMIILILISMASSHAADR